MLCPGEDSLCSKEVTVSLDREVTGEEMAVATGVAVLEELTLPPKSLNSLPSSTLFREDLWCLWKGLPSLSLGKVWVQRQLWEETSMCAFFGSNGLMRGFFLRYVDLCCRWRMFSALPDL